MMEIAQLFRIDSASSTTKRYDTTRLIALALSIVFLIAFYLAVAAPGTASGEFASMTVFP